MGYRAGNRPYLSLERAAAMSRVRDFRNINFDFCYRSRVDFGHFARLYRKRRRQATARAQYRRPPADFGGWLSVMENA